MNLALPSNVAFAHFRAPVSVVIVFLEIDPVSEVLIFCFFTAQARGGVRQASKYRCTEKARKMNMPGKNVRAQGGGRRTSITH